MEEPLGRGVPTRPVGCGLQEPAAAAVRGLYGNADAVVASFEDDQVGVRRSFGHDESSSAERTELGSLAHSLVPVFGVYEDLLHTHDRDDSPYNDAMFLVHFHNTGRSGGCPASIAGIQLVERDGYTGGQGEQEREKRPLIESAEAGGGTALSLVFEDGDRRLDPLPPEYQRADPVSGE
jgi:hypothetical protein